MNTIHNTPDYNTQRPTLRMPEYGRCISQMVEHACSLPDRNERLRCANTIINVMATMVKQTGDAEEFKKKLWNHLAAISGYQLDIDYPVDIERTQDQRMSHQKLPYPQHNISRRHYGRITEQLMQKATEIDNRQEQAALLSGVANQMKRSLAKWNREAMTEQRVLDDMAAYTDGQIALQPGQLRMLPDADILSSVQQVAQSKKKKKRKK